MLVQGYDHQSQKEQGHCPCGVSPGGEKCRVFLGARLSIYLGGYTERVQHTTRGVVADTLAQDLKETLANVGAKDSRVLFLNRS